MIFSFRTACLLPVIALLCACGGGDASTISPFSGLPSSVLGTQPSGTARLRGTAVLYQAGRPERLEGDGTLNLDTGAASYTEGSDTLIDPDGFNRDGLLTDGTLSLQTLAVADTFSRVRPYIRPAVPGITDWSAGVIGFRAKAARIAATGSATYTGPATLFSLAGAGASPGSPGSPATATLTANFGTSSLDLAITGVAPNLIASPNTIPGEIRFNGMQIVGAQFRGGSLAISPTPDLAGLGRIRRSNARGQFFGQTSAAGHPDEAGGALLVVGRNAALVGVFVAD